MHHTITKEQIQAAKQARPEAKVLVHPECRQEVTALADYIGSTSGIILLLIPFIGFLLGYMVEVMMSIIEHAFYFFGRRRSAKDILQGFIFKGFNPRFLSCKQ